MCDMCDMRDNAALGLQLTRCRLPTLRTHARDKCMHAHTTHTLARAWMQAREEASARVEEGLAGVTDLLGTPAPVASLDSRRSPAQSSPAPRGRDQVSARRRR